MSYALASIKAGYYVLLDNMYTTVVADVHRAYRPAPVGRGWWSDGYVLKWRESGVEERFKTLAALHQEHYIINYPGYGGVLKGYSNGQPSRRTRSSLSSAEGSEGREERPRY